MQATPKTHKDVIQLLGGPTAVARSLGLEPVNTVVHWGTRGIPARYWHKVVSLAASLNPPVPVTADQLERTKGALVNEAA